MHPLIFYTMDKDVGTARWRAIRGVYDRRGVHFDSAGVRPGCPIQHPPIRAKITPPKRRPAAPPGPSTSPIPLIFPHFQNEGILEAASCIAAIAGGASSVASIASTDGPAASCIGATAGAKRGAG